MISAPKEKVFVMPTRVLVELPSYKIVAFGNEARPVEYAGLKQARVIHPFSATDIKDEQASVVFLRAAMQMVLGKSYFLKPRVLLSQPFEISPFMAELWQILLHQAGAREVIRVNPLLATALGAGLPVGDGHGYALGWWVDNRLILGLVAFGHVQFEQQYLLNLSDDRVDLADKMSQAWPKFVASLPIEFRQTVTSEGLLLTIDNDDPQLPMTMARDLGVPVQILPRTTEVLGLAQMSKD